ncbi:hypothetical protein VT84_13995 [Gemmata sp. SH-PL17]|uniref:hypothetical protein n=1 Tax=Gemmata sp. SH-PL17 TaxID=1630693 RepID=UPI00078BFD92|nr:hypothetical protein [Gemmata sp. SH-PL17]AMV24605.1 hypothetical protein VT84_09430 [Gemmata sp. SH-PL17]AMV25506.1 hypothetical protein VT84_13995 [Gemmata sp. SH-PL17]
MGPLLLDRLVNLDRYITDDLPSLTAEGEPAEWLTLANDGEPVTIRLNGRLGALLCFTSATWTDTELTAAVDAVRMAGWPGITGVKGAHRDTIEFARAAGTVVLLDAPLACIVHVVGIEIRD